MEKRKFWNAENISYQIEQPKDTTNLYRSRLNLLKSIFGIILDKAYAGKVDDIAFRLLDDEQFKNCFGICKDERNNDE